jgi:hypothetical protein
LHLYAHATQKGENATQLLNYNIGIIYKVNRGSSVSVVFGYGLEDRAIEVRYPTEAKGFFL